MHKVIGNNDIAAALNADAVNAEKRKQLREAINREVPFTEDALYSIVSVEPRWVGDPKESAPALWDLQALGIPSIWSHYGLRGEGVNVYILDSGCSAHPSIGVKSVKSFVAGVDDTVDEIGHGTWVAGKIGGLGVGIAPKCNLHIVRVLDGSGTGSTSWTNKGLEWVLSQKNVHIVNLSLGGPVPSPEQEKLILKLHAKGVIVVAAAGNQGSVNSFYPGSYDPCITVGAVTRSKQKASFSNFGGQIDIVAPGVECYSSYLGKKFRALEGTSMATPIVTGILALGYSLLLSRRKSIPEIQSILIKTLLSTAQDLGPKGRDIEHGFGGVDAQKFMAAIFAVR